MSRTFNVDFTSIAICFFGGLHILFIGMELISIIARQGSPFEMMVSILLKERKVVKSTSSTLQGILC